MNRNVALVCAALVLGVAGCYFPSPKLRKTESLAQTVGPAGAESVTVSVTLGVGKLRLSGGADSLLDARFDYNIPDWKPVVTYSVTDGLGRLAVEQPSRVVGATWPGNVRYDWDLKLSSRTPMDLGIDMGVGKSDIDLRGIDLRRLTLEAGVGEGSVDLSGPRPSNLDVTMKAGVGKLTLVLPREVGVRVRTQGGLGHVDADDLKADGDAWVNESWGKTGTSIRIELEGGIGEVEMRLVGEPAGGSI